MKYPIIFILIIHFVSCKSQVSNTGKITQFKVQIYPLLKIDSINEQSYPVEVQKLGVQKLYDKTRWFFYANFYGNKLKFKENLLDKDSNIDKKMLSIDTNITYGMLPLRFENIEIRHDSIEIHLDFYFNGLKTAHVAQPISQVIGCVFENRSNDEIVLIAGGGDMRYWGRNCKSASDCIPFENSINILAIKQYLLANKSKVDPWFYQEAIKRGVINE